MGETPLHYAAQGGHLKVCKLIIENVQDRHPKDNRGLTPTMWSLTGLRSDLSSMSTYNQLLDLLGDATGLDSTLKKKLSFCEICEDQFAFIEELTNHYSSVHDFSF